VGVAEVIGEFWLALAVADLAAYVEVEFSKNSWGEYIGAEADVELESSAEVVL
jgi:hypothetical protein